MCKGIQQEAAVTIMQKMMVDTDQGKITRSSDDWPDEHQVYSGDRVLKILVVKVRHEMLVCVGDTNLGVVDI